MFFEVSAGPGSFLSVVSGWVPIIEGGALLWGGAVAWARIRSKVDSTASHNIAWQKSFTENFNRSHDELKSELSASHATLSRDVKQIGESVGKLDANIQVQASDHRGLAKLWDTHHAATQIAIDELRGDMRRHDRAINEINLAIASHRRSNPNSSTPVQS